MVGLSLLALAINGGITLGLWRSRGDLNLRALVVHNLGDAASNVGILIAALVIHWKGILWLDPVAGAMIGAMIGAALIGPLVDSYATPDGVAALLNGIPPRGEPGERPPVPSEANSSAGATPGATPAQPAPAAAAPSAPSAPRPPPQTTAGYRSFDTFAVNYQHGAGDARYSAILRRYGLFSWKLVAVELNG